MKSINIETSSGIESFLYPDNQPHVRIVGIHQGDEVRVVHRIRSSLELIQLLCISNAIEECLAVKKELVVPYLMGARSDRVMLPGDSCELQVVADAINSCGFHQVNLFDVHSDVATRLIKRCRNHNNSKLVKTYDKPDAILIIPDAGALKKAESYFAWNANIVDSIQCVKKRDFKDGKLQLKVLSPDVCAGRNCVVIDDICDGGATFLAIADQVREYAAHLTLIVSHGIFSKGVEKLESVFNEIITSDSYQPAINGAKKVTTISLGL